MQHAARRGSSGYHTSDAGAAGKRTCCRPTAQQLQGLAPTSLVMVHAGVRRARLPCGRMSERRCCVVCLSGGGGGRRRVCDDQTRQPQSCARRQQSAWCSSSRCMQARATGRTSQHTCTLAPAPLATSCRGRAARPRAQPAGCWWCTVAGRAGAPSSRGLARSHAARAASASCGAQLLHARALGAAGSAAPSATTTCSHPHRRAAPLRRQRRRRSVRGTRTRQIAAQRSDGARAAERPLWSA
jgi:hypothetical protein